MDLIGWGGRDSPWDLGSEWAKLGLVPEAEMLIDPRFRWNTDDDAG